MTFQDLDEVGLDFVDPCDDSVWSVEIPLFTIPVKPGRNIPILIETTAMNYRLLKMGYDSAKDFELQLKKRIEKEQHRNNKL